MTPQQIAGASGGVWLLSEVLSAVMGISAPLVALALCLTCAAGSLRREGAVAGLALVFTLFTSAAGTNAVASPTSRAVVARAEAEQQDPPPTPRPPIKPWF